MQAPDSQFAVFQTSHMGYHEIAQVPHECNVAAIHTEHCVQSPSCILLSAHGQFCVTAAPYCPCSGYSRVLDQHAAMQTATATTTSMSYKHHKQQFDDAEGYL